MDFDEKTKASPDDKSEKSDVQRILDDVAQNASQLKNIVVIEVYNEGDFHFRTSFKSPFDMIAYLENCKGMVQFMTLNDLLNSESKEGDKLN